jgi:hypothetical protein
MEAVEVRVARVEEGLVGVKGNVRDIKADTMYIRGKLDDIFWKLALITGGGSVLVSLLTVVVTKTIMGEFYGR